MWRYNRELFRWELISLGGDIKGWIATEVVYGGREVQDAFNAMVRKKFGMALPARAFDYRTA